MLINMPKTLVPCRLTWQIMRLSLNYLLDKFPSDEITDKDNPNLVPPLGVCEFEIFNLITHPQNSQVSPVPANVTHAPIGNPRDNSSTIDVRCPFEQLLNVVFNFQFIINFMLPCWLNMHSGCYWDRSTSAIEMVAGRTQQTKHPHKGIMFD